MPPPDRARLLALEEECAIRESQVVIMGMALARIKDATNFEGARMTASIALIGADFETIKRQVAALRARAEEASDA